MTDAPLSSLDYAKMRDAVRAANAAQDSARTDKFGAWLEEFHSHGWCLNRCEPVAKPQGEMDVRAE